MKCLELTVEHCVDECACEKEAIRPNLSVEILLGIQTMKKIK
jgi:hypothetical protein